MGAGASLLDDGNPDDRCCCENLVGPFNHAVPGCQEECKSDKPLNTPESTPDKVFNRKNSLVIQDTPRFINFELFQSHGSFPRYPNNWNLTTKINDIRRNKSLIVYISHNWLRGKHLFLSSPQRQHFNIFLTFLFLMNNIMYR